VIGLDDLQWADQSSLLTLAALGRRLAGLPAALIACFHGRLDHARGLLDRAAVIYERLEAARDLARTEATMRQLGVRRGVCGRCDRPQTDGRA
jgi:predicted ATPase